MIYILFLLSLVLSFFILYVLSKNDFVLLRKNISLPLVFDSAALSLFLGLIFGRFFYILDSFDFKLFHILSFFHLIKSPGFSIFGFFIGISLYVLVAFSRKKALARTLDIFFLSFTPIYVLELLNRNYHDLLILFKITLIVFVLVLFFFLVGFYKNYTLRDGGISQIIFLVISLDNYLANIPNKKKILFLFLTFSQATSTGIIVFAVIFLLWHRKFSRER